MESLGSLSNIVFGTDEHSHGEWKSTQHDDYNEIPPEAYQVSNSLGPEITDDLRKHHFELGPAGEDRRWESSSRSAYIKHTGSHRSELSFATREDLKASHFTLDSAMGSEWVSSSRGDFKDFSSCMNPTRPSSGSEQAAYVDKLFPFEEASDYMTEAKRSFRGHACVHKAALANSVKEDLRRSHFKSTGDEVPEYRSTFSASFEHPKPAPVDRRLLAELKSELSKSHFDLWQGSMKGYESESKAAFRPPASRCV